MKKVTIKDIARIAGVSRGTVDRVINNRGNVSKDLEKKIMKIAVDLGYEKNILASSLASNRRYQLAIVLPDAQIDKFWNFARKGIYQALDLVKHYGVGVTFFDYNLFQKDSFVMQLDNAINHRPDAVLVAPVYTYEAIEALAQAQALDIPFITINTELHHENVFSYVGQHSFSAGYLAGRLLHLRLKPEDEVVVLNLAHNLSNAQHYSDKLEGFRQYFEDNGMENPVYWYEFEYFKDPEALLHFWKTVSNKHQKIRGLFFTNSRAYHLIQLLEDAEIKRLNIVGFDMMDENIQLLKTSKLDFIINQNPVLQGYNGVMNFVNALILNKQIPKAQYLPLDIVLKENVDFYLKVGNSEVFTFDAKSTL